MRYFLAAHAALKRLESPCVYDIVNDELYELDDPAFAFLLSCAREGGSAPEERDGETIGYLSSEGLITAKPVQARRPPLAPSPVPSLRYLELQITERCNLRCGHCYLGATEGHELSLDRLKDILDQFEEIQGLRLLITGGEPLMHRNIRDFLSLLPAYIFRKVLFTNGLLLTRDLLKDLHVDEVQVSVDGMRRGHETLRGGGTYDRVMDAIDRTLAEGRAVSVATVIHRGNLDEFDEMERTFRALGVRDWTVDAPSPAGNLRDHPLLQVTPEEAGQRLKYGFGGGLHGSAEGFACGLHLAAVLARGTIAKCGFYSHLSAGAIGEGLRKVWARMKPLPLSALECADISCRFLDVCRGGCRYRASVTGDRGPDGETVAARRDYCKCYEYGIISEVPCMKCGTDPEKGGER